jgi:flagellar hook assembly protein FlgD
VDGYLAGGRRTIDWDGKGDNGVTLASGTYFLKLDGAGQTVTRRVNLLK